MPAHRKRGENSCPKYSLLKYTSEEDADMLQFILDTSLNPDTGMYEKQRIRPFSRKIYTAMIEQKRTERTPSALAQRIPTLFEDGPHWRKFNLTQKAILFFLMKWPVNEDLQMKLKKKAEVVFDIFNHIESFKSFEKDGIVLEDDPISSEEIIRPTELVEACHHIYEVIRTREVESDVPVTAEEVLETMRNRAKTAAARAIFEGKYKGIHEKLHVIPVEMKVKMKMYKVMKIPVDSEYLNRLHTVVDLILDDDGCILEYKKKVGTTTVKREIVIKEEVEKPKRRRNSSESFQISNDLCEFLMEKCRDQKSGKVRKGGVDWKDIKVYEEFKNVCKCSESPEKLMDHFIVDLAPNFYFAPFEPNIKILMNYGLDIPVDRDELEKLKHFGKFDELGNVLEVNCYGTSTPTLSENPKNLKVEEENSFEDNNHLHPKRAKSNHHPNRNYLIEHGYTPRRIRNEDESIPDDPYNSIFSATSSEMIQTEVELELYGGTAFEGEEVDDGKEVDVEAVDENEEEEVQIIEQEMPEVQRCDEQLSDYGEDVEIDVEASEDVEVWSETDTQNHNHIITDKEVDEDGVYEEEEEFIDVVNLDSEQEFSDSDEQIELAQNQDNEYCEEIVRDAQNHNHIFTDREGGEDEVYQGYIDVENFYSDQEFFYSDEPMENEYFEEMETDSQNHNHSTTDKEDDEGEVEHLDSDPEFSDADEPIEFAQNPELIDFLNNEDFEDQESESPESTPSAGEDDQEMRVLQNESYVEYFTDRQRMFLEDLEIWMFLHKEIHDPTTQEVVYGRVRPHGNTIWRKYIEDEGKPTLTITSLTRRFRRMTRSLHLQPFSTLIKLKLYFALNIPVHLEFLKSLPLAASVELDSENHIQKYFNPVDGFRLVVPPEHAKMMTLKLEKRQEKEKEEDDSMWKFIFEKIDQKEKVHTASPHFWKTYKKMTGSKRSCEALMDRFRDKLLPECSFNLSAEDSQDQDESVEVIPSDPCQNNDSPPFSMEEESAMWKFALQKIRNPKTGIVEKIPNPLKIWEQFRVENASTRNEIELIRRFSLVMTPALQFTQFPMQTKIELYYGLNIPVDEEFLEKLDEMGDVTLDGKGRIEKFMEKRANGLKIGEFEIQIEKKVEEEPLVVENAIPIVKRKRGRPPGSKNKPKVAAYVKFISELQNGKHEKTSIEGRKVNSIGFETCMEQNLEATRDEEKEKEVDEEDDPIRIPPVIVENPAPDPVFHKIKVFSALQALLLHTDCPELSDINEQLENERKRAHDNVNDSIEIARIKKFVESVVVMALN